MADPILSICIASYNKAELTDRLVRAILGNNNEKFGVVVVDNASTDDTVERLLQIDDSRLKLIVNDHNIGGAANMVHAIYSGTGRYSLYCNDRDLIYPEKIDDFIDFLEQHPDYTCGWVCRNVPDDKEYYTEYDTNEAFKKMCWRCEHPTGFFFNSTSLHKYAENYWERYTRPDGWTAFPFENIQAELITQGKFVRYNIPVWHSTGDETHSKYVSEFEKLNTGGDRWFYPQNCINRGKAYLDQLWMICNSDNISIEEKFRYEVYAGIIVAAVNIGVWRFKRIFETDSLAYHYSVLPKKVGLGEVHKNLNTISYELIGYIRNYEQKTSNYEKIINDAIKQANILGVKTVLKSAFVGKIVNSNVVRTIRGKGK